MITIKDHEIETEKIYMNLPTGEVGTYEDWWYTDENGIRVNAVEKNEVIEVVKDKNGEWIEA